MKKNKMFLLGILALLLVFSSVFTGCITSAVVNGEPQKLGFIAKTPEAIEGKAEIASYWETIPLIMWNGILTFGHEGFVENTRGRDYNLVTRHYYIIQKVSAVEK